MKRISLQISGITRGYLLLTPPRPRYIVLFLHGKGGTAEWADGETGWSQLALREEFALVLPEGLPPNPNRAPKFLTNPPGWNDGSPTLSEYHSDAASSERISSEKPDDVHFLDAVLDDVAQRLGEVRLPVFASGFSNGAGMTFRFAAEGAHRLAAIAPVAGHFWQHHAAPVLPLATLYIVGSIDPLVPLHGGQMRSPWTHRLTQRPGVRETLERWACAIGCSDHPVALEDSPGLRLDTYPGPVPYRALLIEGLGHHWPGGRAQLNPRIAGPASDRVKGTEEIVRFFQEVLESLSSV